MSEFPLDASEIGEPNLPLADGFVARRDCRSGHRPVGHCDEESRNRGEHEEAKTLNVQTNDEKKQETSSGNGKRQYAKGKKERSSTYCSSPHPTLHCSRPPLTLHDPQLTLPHHIPYQLLTPLQASHPEESYLGLSCHGCLGESWAESGVQVCTI
jgi:hypothetical protein